MTSHVATAAGSLPAAELGITLPHEHVFVLSPEFQSNYPGLWDPEAGIQRAIRELTRAYELGIRTIVDMTVLGQGRDVRKVARVAAASPVNFVLATGVYSVDGIPAFARFRGPGCPIEAEEPLIDLLVSDIVDGIGGLDIRAALVKFACEQLPLDAAASRMAAVVAEVSRRTGVPVVVHSNPANCNGLELIRLVTREGVPADRVVISHAGDSADLDYLRALADTGCYLGYDRYGMTPFASDEQRNATLVELIRRGHLHQLLLSQDNASHIDYLTLEQRAQVYPEWSYTHLMERVLPRLRERHGLDDGIIATLMESNPQRLLSPVHWDTAFAQPEVFDGIVG